MSEGLVQRAINNLKKRRQNLLDGKINSIPSPFRRFSYDFPGLEQGVYYGITSYTKGSKTQFTLNLLFEALVYAIEHPSQLKLRVFFYNFEETDEKIMNRFQSWILARVDKIRISPQNLRSTRNDSPLPIEILDKLESEEYKKYFDAFEESFVFSSTANPTGKKDWKFVYLMYDSKGNIYNKGRTNTHKIKKLKERLAQSQDFILEENGIVYSYPCLQSNAVL